MLCNHNLINPYNSLSKRVVLPPLSRQGDRVSDTLSDLPRSSWEVMELVFKFKSMGFQSPYLSHIVRLPIQDPMRMKTHSALMKSNKLKELIEGKKQRLKWGGVALSAFKGDYIRIIPDQFGPERRWWS